MNAPLSSADLAGRVCTISFRLNADGDRHPFRGLRGEVVGPGGFIADLRFRFLDSAEQIAREIRHRDGGWWSPERIEEALALGWDEIDRADLIGDPPLRDQRARAKMHA